MATEAVVGVAFRYLFEHKNVAEQRGSREATFDQIVAEHAFGLQSACQRALEGVHVVDALADEGPFVEEVLVYIGHGARIRVDTCIRTVKPRIGRTCLRWQRDAHARLHDAVTRHHHALRLVEYRAVQGVIHGTDQQVRRVARQMRVGIQRDDVAHRR